MMGAADRTSVAVAVCTYNRNESLRALLMALLASAARVGSRAAVGVVVVDDSSDGRARTVVQEFDGRFELGIIYRLSGRQNISVARNLAIEAASERADWTAMTDDDCEPVEEWLEALLDTQQRTGADAVTGPMVRRAAAGSPSWLTDEPFLDLGLWSLEDGSKLTSAATFNSMIRSQWLKDHSAIRFEPAVGVIGGEDMVFYRAAHAAGLRIHFSRKASVYENVPPTRANLVYQLRTYFWHGNSSYITSIQTGVSPPRMFLHGTAALGRAVFRPVVRLSRGQRPQLRYCLASAMHAFGKLVGPLGVRVPHR